MADAVRFGFVSNEIVVLIVPGKSPGTYFIAFPAMAEDLLFFLVPIEIIKGDFFIFGDCTVEFVNVVVNALVLGFDPSGNINLSGEKLGVVGTCEASQFFNKLGRFSFGNKLGGLNRINKKL